MEQGYAANPVLIPYRETHRLPTGFEFAEPQTGRVLTIGEKLRDTEEAATYRVNDNSGGDRILKILTVPRNSDIYQYGEKISSEILRVNSALARNYRSYFVNELEIAVCGDYIPGQNLEEAVQERNSTFTEGKALDFLRCVLNGDLKRLHDSNIIHRDIKPSNIIMVPEGMEGIDDTERYKLTDFQTSRPINTEMTLTLTGAGTYGYSRFSLDATKGDDYYSLARVVGYLLTGKHPQLILDKKYDAESDTERLKQLPIGKNFKDVLWKMLGHDEKSVYTKTSEILSDLEKITNSPNVVRVSPIQNSVMINDILHTFVPSPDESWVLEFTQRITDKELVREDITQHTLRKDTSIEDFINVRTKWLKTYGEESMPTRNDFLNFAYMKGISYFMAGGGGLAALLNLGDNERLIMSAVLSLPTVAFFQGYLWYKNYRQGYKGRMKLGKEILEVLASSRDVSDATLNIDQYLPSILQRLSTTPQND